MEVVLSITSGPHAGKTFRFDRHDTLLAGRVPDAHLQFTYDDPYFSRRHFLIEVNPPRCRVLDLDSRNGTFVNGQRVQMAELTDGDEVRAGHTIFRVKLVADQPSSQKDTKTSPRSPTSASTIDHNEYSWHPPGYRLLERVGEGAMGVVYSGVRESDNLSVAVKVIKTAAEVSPRQTARFLREAEIMRTLEHQHIVKSIDSGVSAGQLYLVMEWVNGPDLARVVKEKGAMPTNTSVRIACQLLAGLGHAHASGYVHRDIKPSNVMVANVNGKKIVKVADFGMARAYDSCQLSGLTMQGEVGGTPAYMAPEQVSHYRDVKPAADQYSAAATLYNLLTSRYIYDFPSDPSDQLIMIMAKDPVPIRDRRPEIPSGLATAVMRGMSRDPSQRFPDVLAFRQAILPYGVSTSSR